MIDGHWTNIPDAFLPTKILDLCFNILHDPHSKAWIPPHEVKEYKKRLDEQLQNQVNAELEKMRWKDTLTNNRVSSSGGTGGLPSLKILSMSELYNYACPTSIRFKFIRFLW